MKKVTPRAEPVRYVERFNASLPPRSLSRIQECAAESGLKPSEWVRLAILTALDNHEAKRQPEGSA